MKPNRTTLRLSVAVLGLATASPLHAVTLAEFTFSGTANSAITTTGSPALLIPSTNPQFTILDSAIPTANASFVLFGGSSPGNQTGAWSYNGSGTAAVNNDLWEASNVGNPTRVDFRLGLAAAGHSYSLTTIQIDVAAVSQTDIVFEFGYNNGTNQVFGTTQTLTGAGTYSIDISSLGLDATDSAQDWNANNGLRFMFYETTNNNSDGLQISGARVIGTSIPEPSAALLGSIGLLAQLRRRR